MGAVLINEKITGFFRENKKRFVHGFTYSGNPTSCFVGQQVFDIMQREKLFTRAGEIGPYFFAKLHALADKHPSIGDVRGRGLYAGIEFVANRQTREPFDPNLKFTARLASLMLDMGVVISPGVPGANFGRNGDHIQLSPPFTISEGEIDQIIDALDSSLTRLEGELLKKKTETNYG